MGHGAEESRRREDLHVETSWLADVQRENPGLWVAVRDGEVIATRDNPYRLHMDLNDRGITRATIIRCPAVSEPELVGLG